MPRTPISPYFFRWPRPVTTASAAMLFAAAACSSSQSDAEHPRPPCPQGQIFDGQYCQFSGSGGNSGSAQGPNAGSPPEVNGSPEDSGEQPNAEKREPPESVRQSLQFALKELAKNSLVEGSEPQGELMTGSVGNGSQLEQNVTLEPGRCYSVVAMGAASIADLDIQLQPVTPVAGTGFVVAEDKTDAPSAILGAKPNCFHWALPGPGAMRILVSAERGQGLAAAQLFVR